MALLKTSQEAREILEAFRTKTGIRPNLWARAAFGYSLGLEEQPDESHPYDSGGTEFLEGAFFGEDEDTLMALLRERRNEVPSPESVGILIKAHVERGLRHFYKEFIRLNRRGDDLLEFVLGLSISSSDHATSPTPIPDGVAPPLQNGSFAVRVRLGEQPTTGDAVEYILNGPGAAPHVAVMGRNGTGKTRTALAMLSSVHGAIARPPAMLVFDYAKGDIAANQGFVNAIGATVCRLPTDRVPLAPLALSSREPHVSQMAARRFRDTVSAVVHLGAVQKQRCLQLMEVLYSESADGAPTLEELVSTAELMYDQEDWKDDSLRAVIREFGTFPLFRHSEATGSHDFFKQSYVLDLHSLPEDLRKLTTFLVLDKLYADLMALDDAPLDSSGNRQLRFMIVIDEAHHFLPCKQPTLEKMIREVRSKGAAVVLMSQSPDDFDQPKYNFAREIGLPVVFSCVLERPRMLEALLGGNIDPRRLSQLPAGMALTRLPGSDAPIEVRAWRP
jgi:DNA sulfur modification protein DndE